MGTFSKKLGKAVGCTAMVSQLMIAPKAVAVEAPRFSTETMYKYFGECTKKDKAVLEQAKKDSLVIMNVVLRELKKNSINATKPIPTWFGSKNSKVMRQVRKEAEHIRVNLTRFAYLCEVEKKNLLNDPLVKKLPLKDRENLTHASVFRGEKVVYFRRVFFDSITKKCGLVTGSGTVKHEMLHLASPSGNLTDEIIPGTEREITVPSALSFLPPVKVKTGDIAYGTGGAKRLLLRPNMSHPKLNISVDRQKLALNNPDNYISYFLDVYQRATPKCGEEIFDLVNLGDT